MNYIPVLSLGTGIVDPILILKGYLLDPMGNAGKDQRLRRRGSLEQGASCILVIGIPILAV
jgi:hypothetical protein